MLGSCRIPRSLPDDANLYSDTGELRLERGDLAAGGEGIEYVVDELLDGVEEVDEEPLVVLHLDKQCLEVVHQATDAAELIEEHAGVGAALSAAEALGVADDLQAGEERGEDAVVDVLGEETASTSRGGHGGCLARLSLPFCNWYSSSPRLQRHMGRAREERRSWTLGEIG